MKSAPAIAFDVRASRRLTIAASIVGVLAAIAPWLSGISLVAKVALSIGAAAMAFVSLRRFVEPKFRRVAYRGSEWRLVDREHGEHPALLAAHVQLGDWLSLDFRLSKRGRARFVLGPDNIDADTRRRLVLLLARGEIAHGG